MARDLASPSTQPPPDGERVRINIHPQARKRLWDLLWEPEMHGVGYSEFIERACEHAEGQIMEKRRAEGEDRRLRHETSAEDGSVTA